MFAEKALPEPVLASLDLSPDEWREALRACKGMTLRQEVYELDVDRLRPEDGTQSEEVPVRLFSAATHNCNIRRLQPRGRNRHAVFLVTESEATSYHYELDLRADAAARRQTRGSPTRSTCRSTSIGNVQQSVAVGYARWRQFADPALTRARRSDSRESDRRRATDRGDAGELAKSGA